MTPFPWEAAMRFGFGVLRLSPAAFWSLTPRELAAARRAFGEITPAAPGRAALAALMQRYPDAEPCRD